MSSRGTLDGREGGGGDLGMQMAHAEHCPVMGYGVQYSSSTPQEFP